MKTFKEFLDESGLSPMPATKKPNLFHGNYGGRGNRGGPPVDKLDKEFQKHDTGYTYSKTPDDRHAHDKSLVRSTRKLVGDKSLPLKTRIKAGMAHTYFRTKVALHGFKN